MGGIIMMSRPAQGAWIETRKTGASAPSARCRAPRRARGLKRLMSIMLRRICMSRPAQGAWIETLPLRSVMQLQTVAPRAGRVD